MGYYCTVEGCRGNHASKYELCIEPAKATREPTLDEQMAAIDHLRQCWMPETNPTLDAILASLERLKVLDEQPDEYRYKPKMAPALDARKEVDDRLEVTEDGSIHRGTRSVLFAPLSVDAASPASRDGRQGEWVPWKPGDALPEPGEYRVALHPHFAKRPYTVSLKVYGGDCARADAAGWRNQSVIAYFTTPLPPPYEGGNSEAKGEAS